MSSTVQFLQEIWIRGVAALIMPANNLISVAMCIM